MEDDEQLKRNGEVEVMNLSWLPEFYVQTASNWGSSRQRWKCWYGGVQSLLTDMAVEGSVGAIKEQRCTRLSLV